MIWARSGAARRDTSTTRATAGDLRTFRTPWGRWPKWSELYIYTLIGESTPGRVNVAAWENIAGPQATVTRPLGKVLQFRFSAYLSAGASDRLGRARGVDPDRTEVRHPARTGRAPVVGDARPRRIPRRARAGWIP